MAVLRRKAGAQSAAVKEYADVGKLQQDHFDSIASDYAAHYGDPWSQVYRRRFINEPMLGDIDLSGARVIDAMCGSGETTGFLLEKGAQVTGVDISQKEMTLFQERFPSCSAKQTSILSTDLESNAYDCVVVVGGLHHLHPQVPAALNEVHRLLKPGGYFCFTEPHRGSLADRARQLWYGVDELFAANEAAIDLEALKEQWASRFEFVKEEYKGNIAYLLVLNSLIFRIPLRLKPLLFASARPGRNDHSDDPGENPFLLRCRPVAEAIGARGQTATPTSQTVRFPIPSIRSA